MRKTFLYIIIILLNLQVYSQRAGLICPQEPCECQSDSYSKKNYIKAKYYSDECLKQNDQKHLINSRTWFYRGLVYQEVFEDFDSIYNLNIETSLINTSKSHLKVFYHHIPKDSALIVSAESYLKFFCYNISNDSLQIDKILTDTIYRVHNLEKLEKFEFKNKNYQAKFRDIILPKILKYIEKRELSNWNRKEVYLEIFHRIIERNRKIK